jgi:hypothetical protein
MKLLQQATITEIVRGILGLMLIGAFIVVTTTMLLYALFSKDNVDLAAYSEFFLKTSGVYTGIVGVVVGYYFARATERAEAPAQQTDRILKEGTPNPKENAN